ncbi:hypothetical protein chiPu_0006540 [Chiloscyllium punctatum]|uniref:Uncharacterized protein n=1 Tax=Chiloscyllium punctatum TaxID=137246 RepID=A0A401SCN4_CHIPU|nr:hypothetical protein [Chiloscyllium punctatum]
MRRKTRSWIRSRSRKPGAGLGAGAETLRRIPPGAGAGAGAGARAHHVALITSVFLAKWHTLLLFFDAPSKKYKIR